MRFFISAPLAVIPALITGAQSWSKDVHQQIGYMAEEFLNGHTTSILQEILEPEYEGSIGRAAAWADDYAHTDEGEYSYQWHWIDASDQPPLFCNLYYNRDCTSGGCIVQAIANQTVKLADCVESVQNGDLRGGSDIECSNALKWVVHFLGDIAQPLHTSGVAVGGNEFDVVYGGEETNLHSVWDGNIIRTAGNVTEFANQTLAPFFHDLVSRIKQDTFFIPTDDWTTCTDPSTPIACALSWARDSNEWNCDYVHSQIFNNTDLLTSGYAEGGIPIVELQASKAALRLGTWLNEVVRGRYNQDRQVILENYPSWLNGSTGGI